METGGDYLSLWFLGEALNRAGPAAGAPEESEAIGVLTRSIDANPNVAQPQILLAKLLARRGEPDARKSIWLVRWNWIRKMFPRRTSWRRFTRRRATRHEQRSCLPG